MSQPLPATAPNTGDIRLGQFAIRRRDGVVKHRGQVRELSPRALQVLDCLVEAGTDVVPRAVFIERVWDGNYGVGEHGVRDAIWELRKVFGDDPRSPQLIKTVPRQGYRLLVTPNLPSPRVSRRRWASAAAVTLSVAAAVAATINNGETQAPVSHQQWSGPPPVVSGDAQRLALVHAQGGQPDLYVMSGSFTEHGSSVLTSSERLLSDAEQITNSRAKELSPVWAPNHRDLAFVEYESASKLCRVRVYLAAANRVTTVADDCRVVAAPIAQVPAQLAWSPDNRRIAYQSTSDGAAISSVSVDGTDPARLTDPGHQADAFPRWSADGALAFLRLGDPMMGFAEVHVLNPQAEPVLQCRAAPVWGLAWADDRYLAVTAALNNPFDLWLYDTATGLAAATGQRAQFLQPTQVDGALLVDRYANETVLRQRMLIDDRPPGNLGRVHGPVDYSPVSGMLARTTYRDGNWHLSVGWPDQDGTKLYSAREIYQPRFSADGRRLGWTARNKTAENAGAFVADLADRRAQRVSSPHEAVFFAEWAADDNSFYGLHGVPAPLGSGAALKRFGLDGVTLETIANNASMIVRIDGQGDLWWSDDAGLIYQQTSANASPQVRYQLNSVYESWTLDPATQTLYASDTKLDETTIVAIASQGETQAIEQLVGHLDTIVGLSLGPESSLLYRRNAYSWRRRQPVEVEPLLRSTRQTAHWRAQCMTTQTGQVAGLNHH